MKQNPQNHIHHYHRHIGVSYPSSVRQRLYSFVLFPLLLLVVAYVAVSHFHSHPEPSAQAFSWGYVVSAVLVSFVRLFIAYAVALTVAIPLALWIDYSPKAEKVLLPLFDIVQSVPVLAFFPVVILFFAHYGYYNGAAIFILILTMMWSVVFNVVGGLKVIPTEIKSAAQVFGIRKIKYVDHILLPAVVPYIVTGSLLAWAGGWNIIIVAEVLHTYLPSGAQDLFGIGSALVSASASGQQHNFFMALIVLIIFVGLLNLLVWQKLLHYAERFRFE